MLKKRKSRNNTLGALALCAAAMGVTQSAHASYWVELDCHGVGDQPPWASTTSAITVEAKINNSWTRIGYSTVTAAQCAKDVSWHIDQAGFNRFVIQELRISTSGWDAFFLDRLKLGDSTGWRSWGINNNYGWCISRAASDGYSPFCDPQVGTRSVSFKVNGDVVLEP